MPEMLDIVDENGIPTGRSVPRTVAHAEGLRHRTSHVWIVRRKAGRVQVLLQMRCAAKDSYPGCYDISSAGHIPAGDEFVGSALRELREETGAVASELIPLGPFYPTCAYSTEVIHMYLARQLTFGERELDEDEFLNVFRLPLRELVDRVLRGEIPDAKTQAAALRVWCMLQEGKLS